MPARRPISARSTIALCLLTACGEIIGIEDRPLGDPLRANEDAAPSNPSPTGEPDGGASLDGASSSDSTSPPPSDATLDAGADSGPATSDANIECADQTVVWGGPAVSCSASSGGLLANAGTRNIVDSELNATGTVTITCKAGQIELSSAKCETPQIFDLNRPDACGSGYCGAAVGGQCGVPDTTKAKQLCTLRGYNDYTTYATGPGPEATQCDPNGSNCFFNKNGGCNIVFTSVTCKY